MLLLLVEHANERAEVVHDLAQLRDPVRILQVLDEVLLLSGEVVQVLYLSRLPVHLLLELRDFFFLMLEAKLKRDYFAAVLFCELLHSHILRYLQLGTPRIFTLVDANQEVLYEDEDDLPEGCHTKLHSLAILLAHQVDHVAVQSRHLLQFLYENALLDLLRSLLAVILRLNQQ